MNEPRYDAPFHYRQGCGIRKHIVMRGATEALCGAWVNFLPRIDAAGCVKCQKRLEAVLRELEKEGVTRVVNIRKEKCDVYIGRSSGKSGVWGNPFSHMPNTLAQFRVATREESIAKFREWFIAQPALVAKARRELRGKVLGCFCKPAPCHGDVNRGDCGWKRGSMNKRCRDRIEKALARSEKREVAAAESRPVSQVDIEVVQDAPPWLTIEPFYTRTEVAALLKFDEATIKKWMEQETEGVIRHGNPTTTSEKRRYVTERYSASAVRRLVARLTQSGGASAARK